MAAHIPLTSKTAGELNVHYYREGVLQRVSERKIRRGRDREKEGGERKQLGWW